MSPSNHELHEFNPQSFFRHLLTSLQLDLFRLKRQISGNICKEKQKSKESTM